VPILLHSTVQVSGRCVARHFGRTMLSVFDFKLSVIWPKTDYATTLTSILAKPR
jgi:hypothetical protein